MTVGPFDLRKRRSRCVQCSSSHLKCSGEVPCGNCTRRGKVCSPPTQDNTIKVTTKHAKPPNSPAPQQQVIWALARPVAVDKQSLYVVEFFDKFLERNSFTGRPQSSFPAVRSVLEGNQSLLNVISAIGALQVSRWRPATCTRRDALVNYRDAVTALQSEIECAAGSRHAIVGLSWSTLFLGLFELMYESTGDGWIRHMIYGTSRLLQLLTPEGCSWGPGREFYLEARIFEVARSMLFVEESFLTTPPWKSLTLTVWSGTYAKDWTPLESLLDIMITVADLCIRAMRFILPREIDGACEVDVDQLRAFAEQGAALKTELTAWSNTAREWYAEHAADGHNFLSAVYYSAISIYHSGIYDYSDIWRHAEVTTPSLPSSDIQQHVRTILHLSTLALHHTNLSSIVFLLPLRIAGARAKLPEQRAQIRKLLITITNPFRAAKAIISDLEEVWTN
ncbi:hypothetical protein PV08_07108 [Exophiala spinifera]|uniref:Zn(2)-C6 fungal-type domain-containing protein n=1 Tax=Exophiala spinifera TaxID=91928 RepID=A0A0D1YHA0_9EURO|nr:uncharacterized protein PV08_07108 [Exophiala spinifera]KIW14326.1 hypothetical protein PV08_07108 [Exophiala spinifera]